jgi:gliding motility-associated-like protein
LKNFLLVALVFAGLCGSLPGLCQYSNLEFVENKGQWDQKVKFKGLINNGAFFLEEKGFTVLKSDDEDMLKVSEAFHGHYTNTASDHSHEHERASAKPKDETLTVKSHAYKVQFVNAKTPTIVGDKPLNTANNYFIGNDPSKWASDCKIFQAVTYQNLYPGVDVRYYTNSGKMKYDIIVKEDADLSSIAMKYDGVDRLSVQNEELVVSTSVGDMKELAPYAYQIVNGVKKDVVCRFKVSGKLVQFNVQNYQKNAPLIIDPFLVFSTFTGSSADNWGYTATYGPDGTFYAGGIVFGQGFPVSTGAFQTNYQGGVSESNLSGYDIGIMKFNATGTTRVYATYIGGNGNDQPHSLVVDAQGNLVIAGRTNSGNYPTTGATFGPGGDYDIVITKLNANGNALIGSRKIGGSARDGVNIRPKYEGPLGVETIRRNYGDDSRSEVILDGAGNILVASNTQSANFPATAGAFQPAFSGVANNRQDGVVIKTTPDVGSILFSSFLGGGGDDAAFVLAVHPQTGNIYVGGNTTSTDLPGNTAGAVYPTFQNGATDGFVTIINPAGTAIVKTTYIGTPGNDMLYGIQFDKFGYPYVMGTTSSNNWPISNAAYSVPGGKQFIAKLQPDLSAYVYSTVFGTSIASSSPNISPIAFLVDRCENVYVSGWGGEINSAAGSYPNSGTTALPVTSDAYQNKTDGSDFYFFVMERNATRQLYGTYFGQSSTNGGGEHVDGGTSRFDRNGVIYQAMCANCGRTATFPTTPGVWAGTNGSPSCNLAAVKMSFDLAGISNSVRASINGVSRDTSGCVPLKVDFADTVAEGKKYIWNFGDGSPSENTTTPNNSHTYNNIGSYRVMLVSIDSTSCNIADTAYTTIIVRNDVAYLGFDYSKQGGCASTTYRFNNTSTGPANKPFGNQSFRWNFGDGSPIVTAGLAFVNHTFPSVGSYRVTLTLVDTNYCNAPDSLPKTIRIAQNVKAAFKTPPSGCAPYTAVFTNESQGGVDFLWMFGDNTTSTVETPIHDYPTPGTYTITLVATDTSTCNKMDTFRFTITVSGKPTASFYFTPNPPQANIDVEFFNTSIGATRYIWNFGDGDTLSTTSTLSVKHSYNETRLFNACLIAINAAGCPDTICQPLEAKVIPLLDVPSAFTPNGDGVNDRVFVRGFGISKMTWRIYNRWGIMVFQTVDRHTGWDGRYNGEVQPKEVYHYVLDVEFAHGDKYQKKGDITLL